MPVYKSKCDVFIGSEIVWPLTYAALFLLEEYGEDFMFDLFHSLHTVVNVQFPSMFEV